MTATLQTRDQRTEAWRAPTVPEGDTLIHDEPGRVLILKPEGNADVCFSAYHFRVTGRHGLAMLRVKHGGGEESWRLPSGMTRALADMTSDQRYFTLHAIMDAHHASARAACDATAHRYMQAHAEGRLMRRKVRGQARVRVWIEPAKPADERHA